MRGRARPTPDPFLLGPRPRGDDVAGRSGGRERERRAGRDPRRSRVRVVAGGGSASGGHPGRAGGAWGGGRRAGVAREARSRPLPTRPPDLYGGPPPFLALLPRRGGPPTDPTGRPGRQRPPARTAHARARAPGARLPVASPSPPLPFPAPRRTGGERLVRERATGRPPRSRNHVNDPSAGSPTETLLRLLLPLDSQVRPSSQRSARAVGRPRRGRSEGLTKPSNR